MSIRIYTAKEIQNVIDSGTIAYETHMHLTEHLSPGISTYDLDRIAYEYICEQGGKPAFLGYQGYQATLCTSLNDAVVHGLPSENDILKEGDILGIDLGVLYNGYYSDTAWTWPIGEISENAKRLIKVTQESLYHGIKNARPGNRIGMIGASVQKHAESNGYSVVRSLVGHGVGRSIHEEPQVPNFGKKNDGPKIRPGMILAIEPMINEGHYDVFTDEDQWTIRTKDNSLSVHFEHTIAINSKGTLICTLPHGSEINVFTIMDHQKNKKDTLKNIS